MRRGELMAIRWKDSDLDGAKMAITRSMEQTKAGGLRIKDIKTKRGKRTIKIPAYLVAELRSHKKAVQEKRLALGLGRLPEDALVFAYADGSLRKPSTVTTAWRDFSAKLGLGVSFQGLRHTHASTMIASRKMDIIQISRRLGHANTSITHDIYGHLIPEVGDAAADVLQEAFSKRTE